MVINVTVLLFVVKRIKTSIVWKFGSWAGIRASIEHLFWEILTSFLFHVTITEFSSEQFLQAKIEKSYTLKKSQTMSAQRTYFIKQHATDIFCI